MKLVVFAHTPPPHHGQSYMVQLLVESLRKDPAFEIFHVNARLSSGTEDVGSMRIGKLLPLVRYCLQALWFRFRQGPCTFYYVPANPSSAALFRDWIVMFVCRPFFPHRIYHWHAAGLGQWLKKRGALQRRISDLLLARPSLSVVLSQFNRCDAELLRSERVEVVPNGIPDPCPRFEEDILPLRQARLAQRMSSSQPAEFRLLYIGLCLREKGLFDAVEAVQLAGRSGITRVKLTVAGTFWHRHEQTEFERLCATVNLEYGEAQVEYLGFVTGAEKQRLFRESDCLLFPTWYSAESFGLVLVESMAFGLPVITTNWRMIPEVLPDGYPGVVDPQEPQQTAARITEALTWDFFESLRKHYLAHFTAGEFSRKIKAALLSV